MKGKRFLADKADWARCCGAEERPRRVPPAL